MNGPRTDLLRALSIALAVVAATTAWPQPAAAQERPHPAVDLTAGALLFADDGIVKEGFVGGSARFYLTPRISAGPEVAFIFGGTHTHLMLTGNVLCDVLAPLHGRPRRVTPFLVAGGGLFHTREPFGRGTFAHSEGGFTAGGGVRVRVADVSAGVEARLGWEAHFRVDGFLTVRLGS